jgi:hypothetical protein
MLYFHLISCSYSCRLWFNKMQNKYLGYYLFEIRGSAYRLQIRISDVPIVVLCKYHQKSRKLYFRDSSELQNFILNFPTLPQAKMAQQRK